MKQKTAIINAYNQTNSQYADEYINELNGKSLDRLLLARFALENKEKGKLLDIACGPGQTTQFLQKLGVTNLIGLDLSAGMIQQAQLLSKGQIDFQEGNMLNFEFGDNTFGSAICFYGIVHFTYEELTLALTEIKRVIRPNGQFLFSFHIGNDINSIDEFLGESVQMDFYYFEVEKVISILKSIGWEILEVVERHPYEGVEYPSKRGYILVEK